MSEYKTAEELALEVKEHFNGKFGEHGARLDELEQKVARRPGGDTPPGLETAGSQFVEADSIKAFLSDVSGGRRVGVEVKTVATITGATGSGGDLFVPTRDAPNMLSQRPLRVRDLLPVVQVTTGSVEYPSQTARNNSAATVAEGALKPQSDAQFSLVTVPIRTIAHWMLASRQILDDAPQLRGLIDSELIYGLGFVEDNQLLNGAGTGTDLNGIYTQATAFTQAATGLATMTSANAIDVIGAALLQNDLADEPATGIVLHPSDWTSMRLLKNTQGEYILGEPGANVEPRLFGRPVVATKAMGAGNFLIGNFAEATLYDRMAARVELSTEDSDNFRRNLVTLLCEERLGLAVRKTVAFTKGSFAAAIADLTT